MEYRIIVSPEAAADIQRLGKNEPKAFAKVSQFFKELAIHPKTGT